MEWQDIRTAPRDTDVYVKGPFRSNTAYFDTDCGVWFGDEYCVGDHPMCEHCSSCDGYISPTHWSPIA